MVTVICTIAALALVAIGVQALHKGTSHPEGALSLFCAAGGVVLWPTTTALTADHLFHIDGLAHILTDSLLAMTFAFQFRLVRKLSDTWNDAARRLFYATLALIGLHAALWAFDSLTVPGDHHMLWYDHYYAQPVQMMLTYLVLSFTVTVAAVSCITGYLTWFRSAQKTSERATATSIMSIAVGAILYSCLVAAQVTSSASGGNPASIVQYTGPIMSFCALMAFCITLAVLFGQRLRPLLGGPSAEQRALEHIRTEAAKLDQVHSYLVNLCIYIEEKLMRVHQDFSAPLAVEAVTRECNRRNILPERRKIARESIRILTLEHHNVSEDPFFEEDEISEQRGMAEHYLLHADGTYFLAHVYRVTFLAEDGKNLLAPEDLPEKITFEPWHQELAEIVRTVLRKYREGGFAHEGI